MRILLAIILMLAPISAFAKGHGHGHGKAPHVKPIHQKTYSPNKHGKKGGAKSNQSNWV